MEKGEERKKRRKEENLPSGKESSFFEGSVFCFVVDD